MPSLTVIRRSRCLAGCLLIVLALCGCDYIRSALPPSPSPFPTLARLPTVTPVTPSPTFLPTRTPLPQPTTTMLAAAPVQATVVVGANVRTGPGTDFAIVTSVIAGSNVAILGQNNGWYKITMSNGTAGWMSQQVVEVPPEDLQAIPAIEAPEE